LRGWPEPVMMRGEESTALVGAAER